MVVVDWLIFIVGLCFGSFLGAFTYRYPRNVSIAKGRSYCDRCGIKLKWFDNIPLISFIVLGGKCRSCGKKVSFRYPIIEVATAFVFLLVGPNIPWLLLFLILEAIFIIDLEHQIIPDNLVFLGMSVLIFIPGLSIYTSLLSGFAAAAFLLSVSLFTGGRGMGLGDVKLAVLGGMIVGTQFAVIWLFLAFLTGAVVGIILILMKKAHLKDKIAFGPFLIAAIPLSRIFGEKIINLTGLPWY